MKTSPPEQEKVGAGHYRYRGMDIIRNPDGYWDVIKNREKVGETVVTTRPRLTDCISWLDEQEAQQAEDSTPKLNSGSGKPVFILTDTFLQQMSEMEEDEYIKAKSYFNEIVKDESNRIRIIFFALLRRKLSQLEKMDLFTTKVEEVVNANIEDYTPEQLMKLYESISKRMESESHEISRILNSL